VPLPGGGLWRCDGCGLAFRHPLLQEAEYEELYRAGDLGVWDVNRSRQDFRLIRERLVSAGGESADVLDIGCYTGDLLASLPKGFRGFGVEANREAAQVAAGRGIAVVADTIAGLSARREQYDAVVACDVIEHVADPLGFMRSLRERLRPGGRLLITTGNFDSWLWRLMGARYWYCSFPEHISFIGRKWIESAAPLAGMRIMEVTTFNYRGGPAALLRLAMVAIHGVSPQAYGGLRKLLRRQKEGVLVPPGIGATRDHMLCVLSAV
jgi:SAM-dependent methyltransferase